MIKPGALGNPPIRQGRYGDTPKTRWYPRNFSVPGIPE